MVFERDDLRSGLDRLGLDPSRAREELPAETARQLDARAEREPREELAGRDYEVAERDLTQQSAYVTYALLAELERGDVEVWAVDPDGASLALTADELRDLLRTRGAVGLLEPALHPERETFGITIRYPQRSELPPAWGYVEFLRLGIRAPLLGYSVRAVNHAPPNPKNATTTCFARDDADRSGVITAAHAVAGKVPRGRPFLLDTGATALLRHVAPRLIDAAFLETPALSPGTVALDILEFPAPGDPVVIETKTGKRPRTVTEVNGRVTGPYFTDYPVMIYLDDHLDPGDSGALVRAITGEGVGIYKGAQQLRHHPRQASPVAPIGVVQNLTQALYALQAIPLEEKQ
jgi:hypothetical protein